ncbi:MAG TPA: valine--tRNA ligase [Polyangia bacterium]|nr:valine--tRNA ligase [Polyangia bacterium]
MNELPKVYDPAQVEGRWYREWIEQNVFHADANTPKAPYTIVIPPPNVTGSLHIGHALFATLQDILTRWRRMQGYNALWLPGTDHAGIATQLVVERRLWREEQKTRQDLGREAFLERVWQWKQRSGGRILEQLKVLGASCDWPRERFTMDEGLSRAVREAFVRLYEEGLIYRARRLINWCPRCHSALSDLEVEHTDTDGKLWHIAYPVEGSSGGERLVVATTRPETLLGDTAVAVHPEDERFRHLIGRRAELPLTGRTIPIIGDAVLVDREFGTGAVKVTPGHDFNDFETGLRHGLEMISVFDADAKLNENAPAAYRGLTTKEARERVLADLKAAGLLQGEEPHKLSLGQCERCGTVVEPMLSLQWFVKTGPLARPAIEAVEQGKTRFVPENWTKTYMHWMTNIKDWCISRQLWWGHRIPAWYCAACQEPTVARETPAACARCGHKELRQDDDVLDTWFSSALWPFSTLGWPDDTKDLRTFYPTSVMETGYDIIFFWVARMMMMGLHFMKDVPFQTVFLHALVVDENGDKMSKVKGNVIDPLDVIHGATLEQLLTKAQGDGAPKEALENIKKNFPQGIPAAGADALRFTLAAMAAQGRNIRLALSRVEGYRHFANKLWNAARFTLMNLEGHDADRWHDELGSEARERLGLGDRWILSRLQRTVAEVDQALEAFKFNEAAQAIYRFLWTEFCDWYIELAKPALQGSGTPAAETRRRMAQGVLSSTLEVACRLLHPFMPFVTEEIWQQLPRPSGSSGSIMITMYPVADDTLIDAAAERSMALVQQVVTAVRNLRSEYHVGPGVPLDVTVMSADAATRAEVEAHAELIQGLGRVRELQVAPRGEPPHGTVVSVIGGDAASAGMDIDVAVNLEGQIDVAAERVRIAKDLAKTEKDLAQSQAKLEKPSFVERAPPAVVEEERRRLAESQDRIAKLKASLERLGRL